MCVFVHPVQTINDATIAANCPGWAELWKTKCKTVASTQGVSNLSPQLTLQSTRVSGEKLPKVCFDWFIMFAYFYRTSLKQPQSILISTNSIYSNILLSIHLLIQLLLTISLPSPLSPWVWLAKVYYPSGWFHATLSSAKASIALVISLSTKLEQFIRQIKTLCIDYCVARYILIDVHVIMW